MLRTLEQLAKEFWIPFLVAAAWTGWMICSTTDPKLSTWAVRIATFSTSFFLASWATGQVNRVRKQARVEDSFQSVEGRLDQVVTDLDTRTRTVIDSITGGESFCFLSYAVTRQGGGVILAVQQGAYPLYDVHARIVDLDAFDRLEDAPRIDQVFGTERNVDIGVLVPEHAKSIGDWMGVRAERFNVFFTARNGSWVQYMRRARIENEWVTTTRVIKNVEGAAVMLHEQIDPRLPIGAGDI